MTSDDEPLADFETEDSGDTMTDNDTYNNDNIMDDGNIDDIALNALKQAEIFHKVKRNRSAPTYWKDYENIKSIRNTSSSDK